MHFVIKNSEFRIKNSFVHVTVVATAAVVLFLTGRAQTANEGWLNGTIKATAGAPLEGVAVSAQVPGEAITTSVFTGADGRFFFPAMKAAKYKLRAQVIGYEASETELMLSAQAQKFDFTLKQTADLIPQLSGYQVLAALPEDTVAHRRGKALLQKSCTYCHEASTALRPRFDQHGWEVIVGVMSHSFSRNVPPLTPLQKELATYLAEIRGPGKSPMTPKPFHLTGEATLPVVYEYDVRYPAGGYTAHNGADWRYGPGSTAGGGGGLHDAVLHPDGNIYFTSMANSATRSIGKMDTKTGETTDLPLPLGDGTIARSHGMYMSDAGIVWFNAAPQGLGAPAGNSVLGRLDPRTGLLSAFNPPGMRVTGWLGGDAKGYIWTAAGGRGGSGALRFDPRSNAFTEFRSGPHSRSTYGVTGDAEGNAWWMGVADDVVEYSDASGKVHEIALPERPLTEYVKPGDFSERIPQPGIGGLQSPRRPRADHKSSNVWVPNWFGNTLVRIDARTAEIKYFVPPYPGMSPYEVSVDSKHRVWVSLQDSDEIARFDPDTEKWTIFGWPTRGTAQRHQNILEHDGVVEVVLASDAANRVGRMVMRTAADIRDLSGRAR